MNTLIACPSCKTVPEQELENCAICGYPFSGNNEEKSKFIARQILNKGKIADAESSIKSARLILFIIAGFNIIASFFQFANVENGFILIVLSNLIGLIFLFFAFIIKKKPFIFTLIPLVLLIMIYTADAIIEPNTLIQGFIWKVIFISGLVYSLIKIKEKEKIKKTDQMN